MPIHSTRIQAAVTMAVDNVVAEGLSDIFPRCFELEHLADPQVRTRVETGVVKAVGNALAQKKMAPLEVHPVGHVLFPKRQANEYRRAALIEPVDTIKYLTLVLLAVEKLEASRIPPTNGRIHSYRYLPAAGRLFDPTFSYSSFKAKANEVALATGAKVVVRTDVAAFYDRVNLHRLESVLDAAGVEPELVGVINELLLAWSNRDSYGLPVGSNASRILAEAAMSTVDDFLVSHDIQFVRFVDDFMLFANNAREAHYALSLLVHALASQGLQVAARKTRLMDVEELRRESSARTEETDGDAFDLWAVSDDGTGYSGLVPTVWKTLTPEQVRRLSSKTAQERFQQISAKTVIDAEEVRDYFNAVAHEFAFDHFGNLARISESCPALTPFLVDMVVQHGNRLSGPLRARVADEFAAILTRPLFTPEYVLLAVIRLLSDENFARPDTLFRFVRTSARDSGNYAARAAIMGLEGRVSRSQAIELRTWFERASLWERRAIIRVVSTALSEAELRPWLKNVRVFMSSDPLMLAALN